MTLHKLPPLVERFGFKPQSEMAWSGGSMRRQLALLQRGFGDESKQDIGLANLEEDATARFFGNYTKAQDIPIKTLSFVEVMDIDGGFNNGVDIHDCLHLSRSFRSLAILFAELPGLQQ